MSKSLMRYFLIGALCVQLVGGVPIASAAALDTTLTVVSPQSDVARLTQLLSSLQSMLALLQQKIAGNQPAAIISSQQNLQATVTATTSFARKGELEKITKDGVITGWVIDPAASSTPAVIEVFADGLSVGTTSTYIYRADKNTWQNATGKHGFIFALSTSTKTANASRVTTITVRLRSNGQLVKPLLVASTSQQFTAPTVITWSEERTGKGIPDVEVDKGNSQFEIFGNRQYAYGGMKKVVAIHSTDGGYSWSDVGLIVTAPSSIDLGDGSMTASTSASGSTTLFFAYRYNQSTAVPPYFSIRLKKSTNLGQTWEDFGTPSGIVHQHTVSTADKNGLWTPQVLLNNEGDLLVNYDDQLTPDRVLNKPNGGGQFGMMRKWNWHTGVWEEPVIIGQGTSGRNDGVGARTQINLGSGRIWSPVESSVGTGTHSLALRFTESYDNGRTWSMTPAALAAKQIVASDWNLGIKDESVLYELPPRGVNTAGAAAWYNWSWPLAVKLKKNPDLDNVGKASAIFVLFRSDEDRDHTVSDGEVNTSHGIDKNIFYLLSTNGAKSWIKGRATYEPIFDHRPVALHDGSVLIGYSPATGTIPYKVKKACFDGNPCTF